MKYVIDLSIAERWYLPQLVTAKALNLRFEYYQGRNELLAPDFFLVECARMLAVAEHQGTLNAGLAQLELQDVQAVGIRFHPFAPLLPRAIDISLRTKITVFSSLYLALAEREQCTFLTADAMLFRVTQKHFTYVVDFLTMP